MSQAPDQVVPLSDVRLEGRRIVAAAEQRGLPVRLLGGVAIWARCPSAAAPPLERSYGDVDIISLSKVSRELAAFIESLGYTPDKLFNALHGKQRLNFTDPASGRPLDVLLDQFAMCHALDLRDRLTLEPMTIPLADLLLTKLQVVQMNDKDIIDITALLADHPVGGLEPDSIDLGRLASVLGRDWGFEHTVRISLGKVGASVAGRGLADPVSATINERIAQITAALDAGHKSVGWQLRARVGERVRWYELPEDVRH